MIRVTYMVDASFLGGAEHYVARLATGLDASRFATSLVMRADDVAPALDAWAESLAALGVPVTRLPMRLPFRPWDALGVYRALDRMAPHVVHINMPGPYNGQMGLLAPIARAAGARVVTTEHLPMVERLWKRALVKRVAIRFVDAAVTMTRANGDLLVSRQGFSRRRVRVVANGIPLRYGTAPAPDGRREWGIEAHEVVVGFVGNLLPHKGLQQVIRALSSLQVHSWRLLVVGSGPDEGAACATAKRCGISERVVFLGQRAGEDVERIIGACDILALPSEVEGLPYVILEAMACGKPVVSTDVYGIPEAVVDGETGLLVHPGDDAALTHALHTLIKNGELRRRMGECGRARFEARFTLERQLSAMSSLYTELAVR
jgi:glycosyltransferase involved in cell wall biosynthesis